MWLEGCGWKYASLLDEPATRSSCNINLYCRVLCNAFGHIGGNYNLIYASLFWIPVNKPTKLFGDKNLVVIQNALMPEVMLQKMHTTISCHRVRECVTANIIAPHKIDGKDNFIDIFTKPVEGTTFKYHAWHLMQKTLTSQK